jgi:hypothetical protein
MEMEYHLQYPLESAHLEITRDTDLANLNLDHLRKDKNFFTTTNDISTQYYFSFVVHDDFMLN